MLADFRIISLSGEAGDHLSSVSDQLPCKANHTYMP